MSAFERMQEGGFSALDLALAESFESIWPDSDASALQLAALASWAVGQGHSCFSTALLADWPSGDAGERFAAIRADAWPVAPFIGDPASGLPIVVDGPHAWLRRYWTYEREIEVSLQQRSMPYATLPDAEAVRVTLDRLLPPTDPGETDWQRIAAVNALRAPLTVICGGPGTGKTYTALRVLALIQSFSELPLRMGLAAPTGKAAQRLGESVRQGLEALPLSDAEKAALPDATMTVHRLLGMRPQSVSPRFDASRPLDLDVLVVDECSMLDLPLMAKLLRALKPGCRLILLGDPDQLPAVENGAVLATVAACNPDNRFSAALAPWMGAASSAEIMQRTAANTIGERVVRLERPRRFGGDSGIARLVRAIRAGDAAGVFEALSDSVDILWNQQPLRFDSPEVRVAVREAWQPLQKAETPEAALQALDRYRILSAMREGPHGVTGLNQAVAQVLHGAQANNPHLPGRPILVTSNQPALGLYNGDVGVLLSERPDAPLRAWFSRRDGGVLALLPAQLPAHQSAWAMTVHKAQGSEFDRVELVLPSEPHPLLSREWLYTAASRARKQLIMHASREVISAALGQRTRRINGLNFVDPA
ncbi:exodeoxyribonuclease V subunit alpha [Dokdonella sp.]|uniref:exodeoxyribonuclease V subunit alpha n=1 Tax=Dokdonella sp. TaxID=2291710 RepID=UPI0035292090